MQMHACTHWREEMWVVISEAQHVQFIITTGWAGLTFWDGKCDSRFVCVTCRMKLLQRWSTATAPTSCWIRHARRAPSKHQCLAVVAPAEITTPNCSMASTRQQRPTERIIMPKVKLIFWALCCFYSVHHHHGNHNVECGIVTAVSLLDIKDLQAIPIKTS